MPKPPSVTALPGSPRAVKICDAQIHRLVGSPRHSVKEENRVADDAYGAIVAKRRLARRLMALRLRAGLGLNEAGDQIGWSRGRLDRYERNEWRP
jgi:hypothetical protein